MFKIISFLTEKLNLIFDNSSISTLFSGLGTTLIPIASKLFKHASHSLKTDSKNQLSKPDLLSTQNDINKIEKSISSDLSSVQKQVYNHYFNKYKEKFSSQDVKKLEKKSSEDSPNYADLLSILLGLIESLNI